MPRFVVLRHETPPGTARPTHFDLMLEAGVVLRTWALPQPPEPAVPMAVAPLPDHRREYLDYEGPVSGDRGSVRQWDAGEFDWVQCTDDAVAVDVAGRRLSGRVQLSRSGAGGWLLEYVTAD